MTVDSGTDSKADSDSKLDADSDSSVVGPPPEVQVGGGSARPVLLATLLAIVALALSALGYALWSFASGPELVISQPGADGVRTLARKVEVAGHIVGEAPRLTVNGREIPLTESEGRWTFAHPVPLEPGSNHLLFEAVDGEQETQALRKVESLNALLLDLVPSETGTVTSATTIAVRGRLLPALPGIVRVAEHTAQLDREGRFALPAQPLNEGVNVIPLAVEPKGEETLIKQLRAVRDTTAPTLAWAEPRPDAAVLENQIMVRGEVEDAHLQRLTLNGQEIATANGKFEAKLPLGSLGPHRITLIARDTLGHETKLVRTVRRVERLPGRAAPELSQRWKKVREQATRSLVLIVVEMLARRDDGTTVPFRFQGTGVFVSRLGHVIAPKRLIQPWKYRDFATRLAAEQVSVIGSSTHIHAWTHGARVKRPDGELDLASGYSTRRGTLARLRSDPDAWEGYTPPGANSRLLMVHKDKEIDGLSLLRLAAKDTERLPFVRRDMPLRPGEEVLIVGFPPGALPAKATATHALGKVGSVTLQITMDAEPLSGFLGGPLLNRWGRIVGIAEHLRQGRKLRHVSLHVGAARRLLYGTGYGRKRPRVPW